MSFYWEEVLRQQQEIEDLVTIEVPEDSLILTPNMSKVECENMFNEWLKERKKLC
jgi:hypothetical protein